MTLTLEDVRNQRFRMARKSGYEVVEVDEFVDRVEATFEQLTEENANLRKQVEALRQAPAAPVSESADGQAPATSPASAPIVVTTGKEASAAVVRLVEMSTEQAERLVAEATEEANRIREEAARTAEQLTAEAQSRAERVRSDAVARAERLDQEIEARRRDMFGELQRQRDQLSTAVRELRAFENAYRTNLANHLRSQIENLQSGRVEPPNAPELSAEPGPEPDPSAATDGKSADDPVPATQQRQPQSDTPHLDALLGEQR